MLMLSWFLMDFIDVESRRTILYPSPQFGNVVQYWETVKGTSTEFDPHGNCDRLFMKYKHARNNNCYNYAVNIATNTFAQPGRANPNGRKFNTL